MKSVGLIPARLQSTRLPNKPLVDICGLPMVVHVYRRCQLAKSLDAVYIATDSHEIASVAKLHDCEFILTRSDHETGTDRIAEAAEQLDADIVVNIQGDEALVNPDFIDKVTFALQSSPLEINAAILVNPFSKFNSPSDIKVVLNEKNEVMYLSRNDIPSNARSQVSQMLKAYHIVPFRRDFLKQYAQWPKGKLEQIEFNEYLRILEKGYKILAIEVESSAVSVDTADDLAYVQSMMVDDLWFSKYRP